MTGIIITIVLGVAGIICTYLLTMRQMKKNQIVHYFTKSYDIGKGLTADFPDFELHYGKEVLSNNVKVLQGGFMNVGRNDIDALNGVSDIKLILPEECNIKAIQVSSSNNNLNINPTIDGEKKNVVGFGIKELFMSSEHFGYTAIIEVPEDIEDIENVLIFEHRIKNTEKIEDIYIGQTHKTQKKKKLLWPMYIATACLIVFSCVCFFHQPLKFGVYEKGTNKEVSVTIGPKSILYVSDAQKISFSHDIITIEELNNNYNIIPETTYHWFIQIYLASMLLILVVTLIIGSIIIKGGRKASKIVKVLYKEKEQNKPVEKKN